MPTTRPFRALIAAFSTVMLLAGAAVLASPAQAAPITYGPLKLQISAANTSAMSSRGVVPLVSAGATVTTVGSGASAQWLITFPVKTQQPGTATYSGTVAFFNVFTWRSDSVSAVSMYQPDIFTFKVSGRVSSLAATTDLLYQRDTYAPNTYASPAFVDALNRVSGGGVNGTYLATLRF